MNPAIEETIKEKLKDRKNSHFLLVDGMSKLITHEVRTCFSSVFQCYGFKWMLEINPAMKERRGYLALFLRITDVKSLTSNWQVVCRFKVSLISQTKHIHDKCGGTNPVSYNKNNECQGEVELILHKELRNYIVNDKAVFCVDIIEVKPKFPVTCIRRSMGTANRLRVMEVAREKAKFTWKITQFSSFDGVEHSSYEFTVGPRRWKLEMLPKGYMGKENSLSLYLNASDYVTNGAPKEETWAVYKLRVLDQFQRKHHEMREESIFGYNARRRGINKFLPLGELHDPRRGFLVNDQIYIVVEFLLIATYEYL